MTIYNDVFGGASIYPSDISYSALTLTANVTLSWPEETSTSANLATRIMDLSAAVADWVVSMPDARGAGVGETVLFNNVGAEAVIVSDALGVQIVSVAAGTAWQVYLQDNSTEGGAWASLQYGASLSDANASALAGTGLIAIGTLLSQSLPVTTVNTDFTLGTNSRAKFFVWTGASGTMSLPLPGQVGNNWFVVFRNAGTGTVTSDPASTALIDGASTKVFQPGESAIIVSGGTTYYTAGYGQNADFAFDYASVAIAGTGIYTLSGAELNRIAYDFTGLLTGNREVVVPSTVQQYWVTNSTTGAFTLTIKTAAGTGVVIASGESAILYSNGTNVVAADTAGVSYPIAVAQGGTGATTASAALNNLGATSVGVALFTAVDEAAAWAALGNAPTVTGGVF